MKREEKRKRFHEGLLNMLYPPPPSPPHLEEENDEVLNKYRENLNVDSITDDELGEERSSSSTSDNEEEGEAGPAGKLTRAQRKRIRKKKLKEAASRRRKIIGPVLPTASDNDNGEEGKEVEDNSLQVARENTTEKADTATESSEPAFFSKQSKLRCRRMAKKLATERSKSTSTENEHQGEITTFDKN